MLHPLPSTKQRRSLGDKLQVLASRAPVELVLVERFVDDILARGHSLPPDVTDAISTILDALRARAHRQPLVSRPRPHTKGLGLTLVARRKAHGSHS